jgi:hypothetical protein
MGATNICVPSAKFPWVGWQLSKVHSELFQDCKANHWATEEREQVHLDWFFWWNFQDFEEVATTLPVLTQPDIAKPFDVYCDASSTGLGGVLMQEGQVISYSSWQLRCHEEHYPTHDLELVVVMMALRTVTSHPWARMVNPNQDHYGLPLPK